MYTMKNMADEIGVSKQSVYRIITLNKIEGIEDKYSNKTKLYTDEQFEFIKSRIKNTHSQKLKASVEYSAEELDDIIQLKHENELLKLELKLKDEIITKQDVTINILMGNQFSKPTTHKLYTNDIVDGAVEIKEKVKDVLHFTKKSHNQNPYPEIEQFLIDKGLTIEQIVSDQEAEQFNLTIAENRLTTKKRSEFKKELGELLGHKDSSSTGRTFRSYVKKVLANKD